MVRNTSVPEIPQKMGPGIQIEYNHDLHISDEFLENYPAIREALKNSTLLEQFDRHERLSCQHKRSFERLGLLSLVLGLFPLVIASLRMAMGEGFVPRLEYLIVVSELAGLLAIVLIVLNRWKRHRLWWCYAIFCRERLRQWHFQLFLDGELIELCANQRDKFEAEWKRRWSELQQNFRDGIGMMTEFMHSASHSADFFHKPSLYRDATVASTVWRALSTLRLEHQLRFARVKIQPTSNEQTLSLLERTSFSESIASTTLVGAVAVSALSFGISLLHLFFHVQFPFDSRSLARTLAGTALLLATLSAASRAFRTGYTLPDEIESYEEYCDRIREIQAMTTIAPTDGDRLIYLQRLEEESAAELRRFLRMKMRSTFIF